MEIHDPGLANMAMGGKIPWNLYSNNIHHVSKILKKKYLRGESLCNLQAVKIPKVTITWNLCMRRLDFFQKNLYRIPGNGKGTMLWHEKVMWQTTLDNVEEIRGACEWLKT